MCIVGCVILIILAVMAACQPKIVTVTKEVPGDCPELTRSMSIGGYKELGAGLIRVDDPEKGMFCYHVQGLAGSPVCFED